MRFRLGIVLACAALAAVGAGAGKGEVATLRLGTGLRPSQGGGGGLPQVWVAPAPAAVVIDGQIGAEEWAAARVVTLGGLKGPGKVRPATRARLMHRDGLLLIGIEADEPNVEKLQRGVTQPDGPAYRDDSIELFLSPFPSRGYFQMIISASGAIFDRVGHGQPGDWNAGAKAAVTVGKSRWSLEIAIPMVKLGVGKTVPARWRANIYRNRRAGEAGSMQALSPTLTSGYDVPDRFGFLLLTPKPPWDEKQQTAPKTKGIDVAELADGAAVLRFDLGRLPKGARIHRARLLAARSGIDGNHADARKPVEIYPLSAAFEAGKAPLHDAKPLTLVAPWFRSFEMTELVAAWVGGKRPNHGLYVKQFPGWEPAWTFLDVMYEGTPAATPPQVPAVKALHRSGQTFITFREIEQLVGEDALNWGKLKSVVDGMDLRRRVRYVVYRHGRPITAASLHAAEPIATVKPLSCWNLNGRNVERGIDWHLVNRYTLVHGHWNPFSRADQDSRFGPECPIDRLVIEDGGKPLPRGTGLYVHTIGAPAKAYYAVVTQVDGVQNTADFSEANTAGPLAEQPADPLPVLQGEFPRSAFWNYRETRLHYVRWVGPPYGNRPGQYYNWSVAVPKVKLSARHPMELSLHRDDRSYWRTQYRIERDSVVVTPHDFPFQTWWYGYHESLGTLRSFADGVVQPYTERRLLWFVNWVAGKWPVDRNRVLVTGVFRRAGGGGPSGRGSGCSGALHLAIRHPDCFNMALPGSNARVDYREKPHPSMTALWGPVQWAMKTETGASVWDELDLVRRVASHPAGDELPVVTFVGRKVPPRISEFIGAMLERGQAVFTRFDQWPGPKLLPLSATGTWGGIMLRRDVRRDLLLPTFERNLAAAFRGKSVTYAWLNMGNGWDGEDVVDTPDRAEVTIWQNRRLRPNPKTAITLRRAQKFKPAPGAKCQWKLGEAGGEVVADKDGLITIANVMMPQTPTRLVVTRK